VSGSKWWRLLVGRVLFCTAVTGAITIGLDQMPTSAMAVIGIFAVFFIKLFVAVDFIEGIFGIRSVANLAGFVAAAGVVDAFDGVEGWLGVVGFLIARRGTIGLDGGCGRGGWGLSFGF